MDSVPRAMEFALNGMKHASLSKRDKNRMIVVERGDQSCLARRPKPLSEHVLGTICEQRPIIHLMGANI